MKKKISITLNEKTLKSIDSIVDNINIRNRSQAIEHILSLNFGENKTAVILCGGPENDLKLNGSFRPTVKLKKSQTPVIDNAVSNLRKHGFKNIFVVARHNVLTKIFEVLKDGSDKGVKINYVEEKNSAGTATSLKALQGKVKTPFLVVYGDVLFSNIDISQLWTTHTHQNSLATLLLTTSSKPHEKGNAVVEGSRVLNFVQKPEKSDNYLVFSPIFVCEPEVLNRDGDVLELDVFPSLANEGLLAGHLSAKKERHIHSEKDL